MEHHVKLGLLMYVSSIPTCVTSWSEQSNTTYPFYSIWFRNWDFPPHFLGSCCQKFPEASESEISYLIHSLSLMYLFFYILAHSLENEEDAISWLSKMVVPWIFTCWIRRLWDPLGDDYCPALVCLKRRFWF